MIRVSYAVAQRGMPVSHHILVVDDEPDIRALLDAALSGEGYRVSTASTGQDAWATITGDRPRLVLLDLYMPEMSGQELLARLRAAQIRVPVVFMSAGDAVRREAQVHGVEGYLAKPFELDAVLAAAARFAETVPAE
jgi:CheY-like chemotaxis protein